ncbi:hypothetical protein [Brevundimonas sp.]|uniref:hypothetical protein n=1 Tax=Brevundimonas sp. TaxID=1871086 RepID=UPI002487DBDA|nr:hypothetical protein [Brevundimonas sp.]MDI1280997.1 hypothetical protein [Brevundimonas sp.]
MQRSMSPPDLQPPVLLSLLGGGFIAAFLHAALPTHWLPFVLVGRAQGWSGQRALAAVTAAGLAHIASTALFGLLIVVAALALDSWVRGLLPNLSAALLLMFGLFYLGRSLWVHAVASDGPSLRTPAPAVSDRAAMLGLVTMMAISPGEVLLPLYLHSATAGLPTLALLTLMLALGTVLGMAVFTSLARAGASILRLERWARYEGAVLGLVLIGLAVVIFLYRH